jgi:hypothetical protein
VRRAVPPPPAPPLSAADAKRAHEEKAFFRELAQIKQDGHFAILFFGLEKAGKTWLLHRMKEQLFNQGIACDPEFKQVTTEQGDQAKLRGTDKIEFHYVLGADTFVLIDIPGERTERLAKADYTELRPLLAAMDYAQAMIVALPADVMFFGPLLPSDNAAVVAAAKRPLGAAKAATPKKSPAKPAAKGAKKPVGPTVNRAKVIAWADAMRTDNQALDAFAKGVFRVAGVLSYLRRHKIDPADEQAFKQHVTQEKVTQHIARPQERIPVGGRDGLDCPTFFALTKSDRVLSLFLKDASDDPVMARRTADIHERLETRVISALCQDAGLKAPETFPLESPWHLVHRMRKPLHAQLTQFFPLAKFDYATAFYGHDGSETFTPDHYQQHPQHGVVEVLQWIRSARRLGGRPKLFRKHIAWAASARRYLAGVKGPPLLNFRSGKRAK